MNKQNLTITLTDDELITFLHILGFPSIVGLEYEALYRLDDYEIATRLNSGEQSLINRGLINLTDPDEDMLDNTLVALVGTSALPEATFLLSLVQPDDSKESHYFNATSKLLVEYFPSRIGLHHFDYIPDFTNLIERVQNLLSVLSHIDDQISDYDIQIKNVAINLFIELVQKKAMLDAKTVLIENGIDQAIATTFSRDYTNFPLWIGHIAWNLRDPELQDTKTVIAVICDNYCWLLENAKDNYDLVNLRKSNGIDCLQAFIRLLEPIRKIYQSST